MKVNNRQLRLIRLAQLDGGLTQGACARYGFSDKFVLGVVRLGLLKASGHRWVITAKGEKALEATK